MRSLLAVCAAVLWASTALAQPSSLQGPGWDALRAGDHEQARQGFQRALASRPSDALLHLGLGVATHGLGDDVEARRVLTRALAIEPRLIPATALLGEIVYASGDLPGARDTLVTLAARLSLWLIPPGEIADIAPRGGEGPASATPDAAQTAVSRESLAVRG